MEMDGEIETPDVGCAECRECHMVEPFGQGRIADVSAVVEFQHAGVGGGPAQLFGAEGEDEWW